MKTFYCIVPSDDGCFYVGKNKKGEHVIESKMSNFNTSLVFKTAKKAQEYLEANFNTKSYKIEKVMLDEKVYPNLPE